jgi:hypothetical protein
MPRKPELLEPWMLDAIQLMVRQGLSLRQVALQLGEEITPQDADKPITSLEGFAFRNHLGRRQIAKMLGGILHQREFHSLTPTKTPPGEAPGNGIMSFT